MCDMLKWQLLKKVSFWDQMAIEPLFQLIICSFYPFIFQSEDRLSLRFGPLWYVLLYFIRWMCNLCTISYLCIMSADSSANTAPPRSVWIGIN